MSTHRATITWQRDGGRFIGGDYTRVHRWRFDGGAEITASASPEVVPAAYADASAVDPEEAFVASLASCHMLWFLATAQREGWIVDGYDDEASGTLGRGPQGRMQLVSITLRPRVTFAGARGPSTEELARLHHDAHQSCFLAAVVTAPMTIEPR
ncbi:MAG: OsmC family peroxiredoxin [Myxococcales bacterium]|nr:MAG: OsmC family peroxiredoxin [Myxococcales bacterium]